MVWMDLNMAKSLVYPSGFSRSVNEITEALVTDIVKPRRVFAQSPDTRVETLYLDWTTSPDNDMSWERRRKFILYFNKLYGDFWTWVQQQLVANDYIYDMNLDFLIDTIRFIQTGHRHIHVRNWRDMIIEFPEPRPGIANADRLELLKDFIGSFENTTRNNYIGMWCSHESGFEDMIYTTQIMFGRPVQQIRDAN